MNYKIIIIIIIIITCFLIILNPHHCINIIIAILSTCPLIYSILRSEIKTKKKDNLILKKEQFSNNIINLDNIQKITKEISIIRPVNSYNLKNIKQIIINYLNKIPGFITEEQSFTQQINNNFYDFSNIISYNQNIKSNNQEIILAAHIDSLDFMDGAIDSATSIALIIELTNKIINYNPYYPLKIVFFDGEEAIDGSWSLTNTLIGSKYYVNNISSNNISSNNKSSNNKLVFILDLIGGSIEENKIFNFICNPKSIKINKKLFQINNKLYPDKKIFIDPNVQISTKIIDDDHIPFSNANIPYIHLIPDKFPKQHHTIDDNYSNINWNYINIFSNVLLNFFIE